MEKETIVRVIIDGMERLCVFPKTQHFTMIYRSAAEVHWDNQMQCLHSPRPREWSYLYWFKHIITAVESEYGCSLLLHQDTQWDNVPLNLRANIENWMKEKAEPRPVHEPSSE